jgi:hypothetical protein
MDESIPSHMTDWMDPGRWREVYQSVNQSYKFLIIYLSPEQAHHVYFLFLFFYNCHLHINMAKKGAGENTKKAAGNAKVRFLTPR